MKYAATNADPAGHREWAIDDTVVQLREVGTDHVHQLPPSPNDSDLLVGRDSACDLKLTDGIGCVSRRHARLSRRDRAWMIEDVGSKNGLWIDDARRTKFPLAPGTEIGIGALRLVAESKGLLELRAYLSRVLGWNDATRPAIDSAMRALRLAATLRTPLVLHGDDELPALARELHRRAFGDDRPFVAVDPRRRSPQSIGFATIADSIETARGGTVCVWASRLPHDFASMLPRMRSAELRIRSIVCARDGERPDLGCISIRIPALSERVDEIDRIIDECAREAIVRLGAKTQAFTGYERGWVRSRRPPSIGEIARATERVVALREWGTLSEAAKHLGITHGALSRWLERRR